MNRMIWETPDELIYNLAQRVKRVRKRRKISQEELANMSDVSFGSIKRFETTGQISLISLVKISTVLDLSDELRNLFTEVNYLSIDEVLNDD